MSKKDYEKAAKIARECAPFVLDGKAVPGVVDREIHDAVVESFVKLFCDDNPQFDAERFRKACI